MGESNTSYLAELFRVVEGALRSDGVKVRNYASLLASKLEENGDTQSAKRLRRLIESQGQMLHPARVSQTSLTPVDTESRFPLVEQTQPTEDAARLILSTQQTATLEDFVKTVQHRTTLEQHGLICNTSLLIYGPPGCGKSQLASLIATQLQLPLYVARLDGLISSYLGSTSKNIRAVLEYASRTPCVLFLDEFDAVAKLRDDQQELGELKRVVNTFIQALDAYAHELVVIAATNHEQLLDSAIWRRFHFHLQVGFPGLDQRKAIWHLYGKELGWSGKQLDVMVDISDGYSGAAIANTCNRLRQRKITQQIEPTMHSAWKHLLATGKPKVLAPGVATDDAKQVYDYLHKQNPSLYTLGTVGDLIGVSKATMSRILAKGKTI